MEKDCTEQSILQINPTTIENEMSNKNQNSSQLVQESQVKTRRRRHSERVAEQYRIIIRPTVISSASYSPEQSKLETKKLEETSPIQSLGVNEIKQSFSPLSSIDSAQGDSSVCNSSSNKTLLECRLSEENQDGIKTDSCKETDELTDDIVTVTIENVARGGGDIHEGVRYRHCTLPWCRASALDPEISLFHFPEMKKDIMTKWAKALRWHTFRKLTICSLHFDPILDFTVKDGHKVLKPRAIPSRNSNPNISKKQNKFEKIVLKNKSNTGKTSNVSSNCSSSNNSSMTSTTDEIGTNLPTKMDYNKCEYKSNEEHLHNPNYPENVEPIVFSEEPEYIVVEVQPDSIINSQEFMNLEETSNEDKEGNEIIKNDDTYYGDIWSTITPFSTILPKTNETNCKVESNEQIRKKKLKKTIIKRKSRIGKERKKQIIAAMKTARNEICTRFGITDKALEKIWCIDIMENRRRCVVIKFNGNNSFIQRMEAELEKFRRRKKLEKYKGEVKATVKNLWSSMENSITQALLPTPNEEGHNDNGDLEDEDDARSTTSSSHESIDSDDIGYPFICYAQLGLKILLWFLLFMGFVQLGFGAIYFIVSSLWLIWRNTRKTPRKIGEPSAYSVFNPNCESIDGTLKAEHLEKQLLFLS